MTTRGRDERAAASSGARLCAAAGEATVTMASVTSTVARHSRPADFKARFLAKFMFIAMLMRPIPAAATISLVAHFDLGVNRLERGASSLTNAL